MILFLIFTSFIATIIYNQENIIHPQRRVLQAYHYEWLNHPEAHNMKILKVKNRKDILIVKYDSTVRVSKRSQKVLDGLKKIGYKKNQLQNRGILMMFHGKNGRKEDLLPVAERYISAGFTCILVDLPAHGESSKKSTNYGYMMGDEVLSVVKEYVDVYTQPLYFWGMSLGGRYAITSAQAVKKISPQPKALILVSTFDKLSYVFKGKSTDLFGAYVGKILYKGLAFSLNLFYNFDPEKIDSAIMAQKINIPIFMLHGKEDKLIGYKHGKNLFEQFPNTQKVFHLDAKGNHHNILVTDYPFYLKSIEFLLTVDK